MPRALDIPPATLAGRDTEAPKPPGKSSSVSGKTPLILVVRHGSVTEGGSETGDKKVIRGQAIDEGLSSTGRKEAGAAADRLVRYGARKLYSSPLKRGTETAAIIGERTGLKPEVIDGLKPWNPGTQLAGKTVGAIKDELAYYQSHTNEKPPGGETYGKYYNYTKATWDGLMKEAQADPDHPIIAVAHSRDLLALRNIIAGKGPENIPIKGIPDNGSISELRKIGGSWKLKSPEGVS